MSLVAFGDFLFFHTSNHEKHSLMANYLDQRSLTDREKMVNFNSFDSWLPQVDLFKCLY